MTSASPFPDVASTDGCIQTERLVLRGWCDDDLAAFAAMNADKRVAQFLPATLDRSQSDAFAARIRADLRIRGFGLWAVQRTDRDAAAFIGYIGLSVPRFSAAFTPCVEIGWRLAPEHWGVGLATEGARAVVDHAFRNVGLQEIVSFTVPSNRPSRRIMEKIGMRHDPDEDFDHPKLAAGHPLRRHVLYRLNK